ncbi:MAG: hypothetical protein ACUVV6_08390, partial [Thermoplasmatota archaeon]
MLTTKRTYLYRGLGALACGLVVLGVMLPWAAITDGRIGPFGAGSSPSGWDMAATQKNLGSSLNIASVIFASVLGVLIFAVLGMITLALGRNGVGYGYFLTTTAVFFLVFMLAALPYVQESIPVPEDPLTPEKRAEIEAVNATDPARGSELYSEAVKLQEDREKVLEWKNLKMVPQLGLYLTLAGSVLTYVFARLIVSDSAKLANYKRYAALLSQVHADRKVTKDEAELLARERQLLNISQEEHEHIIRGTVEDPATQQRLLEMHAHPIDVERVLRDREFDAYRRALVQAHMDGKVTEDEAELLRVQREALGITDADHEAILRELVESGEVSPGGSRPARTPQGTPATPARDILAPQTAPAPASQTFQTGAHARPLLPEPLPASAPQTRPTTSASPAWTPIPAAMPAPFTAPPPPAPAAPSTPPPPSTAPPAPPQPPKHSAPT